MYIWYIDDMLVYISICLNIIEIENKKEGSL